MLVRSKFFPQFVEKIEKLKLSLSKLHNKMPKIRSEMLKIKKIAKYSSSEKLPEKISPKFSESRKFSEVPGNFFENFPFSGKLKIWEKKETLVKCIATRK